MISLVYLKVKGFKKALIALVESNSKGTLGLVIGNTDIDYFKLRFRLDEVLLKRTALDDGAGILAVYIPFLEVDLGDIGALLQVGQIELEGVVIQEPLAEIRVRPPGQERSSINVAHEIARFSPGIESFLNHFNIRNFEIRRAGASLKREDHTFGVSMIDLMVNGWNMRDLSDSANIRLMLDGQKLSFIQSEFSFDRILYDYQQNQLTISNYKFAQKDSTGTEMITLEGKSIRIGSPDFEALINSERYVFDKLVIDNPSVTVKLYPNPDRKNNSRHPVSDLLKQNLGNLVIREGLITNALLNMTLYHQDTIELLLPGIRIASRNLVVDETSPTMHIEALTLSVDSSSLHGGGDYSLSFESLVYDHDFNLYVDNINISTRTDNHPLLRASQASFYGLNIFDYIYKNELVMDSVLMKSSVVHLGHIHGSPSKENTRNDGPGIRAGRVRCEDMTLNMQDLQGNHFEVTGLSGVVENINLDADLRYDIQSVTARKLTLQNKNDKIDFQAYNLDLTTDAASLDRATGYLGELEFTGSGIQARRNNKKGGVIYDEWKELIVDELSLTGNIAQKEGEQAPKRLSLPVDVVRVNQLSASVGLPGDYDVSFTGNEFIVNKSGYLSKGLAMNLTGNLSDVIIKKPGTTLTIASLKADLAGESLLDSIVYSDSLNKLEARHLLIGELYKNDSLTGLSGFKATTIRHHDKINGNKSSVDSLVVHAIRFTSGSLPVIRRVDVYSPKVRFRTHPAKRNDIQSRPVKYPLRHLEQVALHHGDIHLNDIRVEFDRIETGHDNRQLMLNANGLRLWTTKNEILLNRIYSSAKHLHLEGVQVVPLPEFLEQKTTEQDVIGGNFREIILENVPWDTLILSSRLSMEKLLLIEPEIEISRDKTMTDPPETEKPVMLADLIPTGNTLEIPLVEIRQGRMTYRETGEKTGQQGTIWMDQVDLKMDIGRQAAINGKARLYGDGALHFSYQQMDTATFILQVQLEAFDLMQLNQMVDPLQAVRIKSGQLTEFSVSIQGNSLEAKGEAIISYSDMHVEIFKHNSPDQRNLGSELLTLLADGIILRHNKENAVAEFTQPRITYKSPVNYWVKSVIHGAMASVRKGKSGAGVQEIRGSKGKNKEDHSN